VREGDSSTVSTVGLVGSFSDVCRVCGQQADMIIRYNMDLLK
jgi:hypothetical protein